MRAAAALRRPVFFMAGLYRGGNRYHVVFREIADFSSVPRGARDAQVTEAIHRYAALVEECCRSDPYNWFNFYDFWHDPGGEDHGAAA
jgi:predicted LPLAT superfamily acyltransferase